MSDIVVQECSHQVVDMKKMLLKSASVCVCLDCLAGISQTEAITSPGKLEKQGEMRRAH